MKLPSRLTSFEQFLFFDDYPSYPNTIGCRLNLTGPVNEPLLSAANQLVSLRNPLLNTILELKGRKPVWTQCREGVFERLPDHYLDRPFIKKIDLDKEGGGQVYWAHSDNQSSLNFLTHHAAADGIGGLQVVLDWLNAYHVMDMGKDGPQQAAEKNMRRTDLALLSHRQNYGFCRWKFLKTLPRQALGLLGVKEFLANHPVSLVPGEIGSVLDPIPDNYPGVYSTEFGDVELVQKRAGDENVTTNDLILQCVFIAIAKWRRTRSLGSDQDLIRLMVPINLRTFSDRYLPASNRSSIVTLDRKQGKCTDEKEFLDTIRFQMNVIKANELGFTFLHVLNFSRWLPRGIRRFADPQRIGATVLVTNLGEPFKRIKVPKDSSGKLLVGNLVLDSFDLIAPLRPNTQAAFAIHRYASKTMLSLTYDNRVIAEEDAKELTEAVCREFRNKIKSR